MCGYCGRALVQQPAGDYACPRCSPLLKTMKGRPSRRDPDGWFDLVEQYRRFQVEAAASAPPAGQGELFA